MSNLVRIGGALVFGIFVVLGSLYASMKGAENEPASEGVVQAVSPTFRETIEAKDSDGDGIPDWEEILQERSFAQLTAPTSSLDSFTTGTSTYAPPSTLTGQFSEAFLQDYLEGKIDGADFSDPESFAAQAIKALENSTQAPKHTRAELYLIETTDGSLRTYGNELVKAMDRHSVSTDHELVLLESALSTGSEFALSQLRAIEDAYKNIIDSALAMQVPDAMALEHIMLMNALEDIRLDIRAMQKVSDDPLLTLTRMQGYFTHTDTLAQAFKALGAEFDAREITFTREEYGSFFYLFDSV